MATILRFFWKRQRWVIEVKGGVRLKRFLDVLISATLLLGLAPLFLIVVLLIKLCDGGPVIYWQTRVGRWGRPIRFPKFRTMVVDADERKASLLSMNAHGRDITFKMKTDPRVTRLGRFLRKYSIDELPQVWLVLKGEMSLVGPRPGLEDEVARYGPFEKHRLTIIPGLTCIWQVSGRGDLPFRRQFEMDMEYIQRQSLWLDLGLLAKTIPVVLSGKGAY